MFVGHYSAAFAAKRLAPSLPLPLFFLACQIVDIFWAAFILLGVEKMRVVPGFTASNGLDLYFMPYTHSLSSVVLWSLAATALFWLATRLRTQRMLTAVVIGAVVASHWLLDLFVHVPDLPLWFTEYKVGFGWWNYRALALLLELALLWGSLWWCLPIIEGKRSRYLLLGAALSGLQVYSLLFQPAEPSMVAVQLLGAYAALTVAAFWVDKRA